MSFNLSDLTNSDRFKAVWGSIDNHDLSAAKRDYRLAGEAIRNALATFERDVERFLPFTKLDLVGAREALVDSIYDGLSEARNTLHNNGVSIPDLYKAGA